MVKLLNKNILIDSENESPLDQTHLAGILGPAQYFFLEPYQVASYTAGFTPSILSTRNVLEEYRKAMEQILYSPMPPMTSLAASKAFKSFWNFKFPSRRESITVMASVEIGTTLAPLPFPEYD